MINAIKCLLATGKQWAWLMAQAEKSVTVVKDLL